MSKILAFVLALLFVLTLPFALLAFNVGRVVYDGALVKRVVTKEVTESDLIAITVQWLAQRRAQERVIMGQAQTAVREPDVVKAIEFPTLDDWRKIKAEALPSNLLADWVVVVVDGGYAWIDTNEPVPNIALDFKPWKTHIRSDHGYNAIQIVYNSLPPCKQPDIDDFLKRLAAAKPGTEVLYNLYTPCMFPDPWRPDQNQDYLAGRDEVVDNVADQFRLTQELAQVEKQAGVGAESIKQQLRLIRTAANLSIIVPIVFLALLVLVTLVGKLNVARWLGLPLLIGGVLSLLPTLAYQPLVGSLLTMGAMSEVPRQVQQEFARAFGVLLAEIFNPMLVEALALMVVGLGIVIVGIARRPKARPVV